MLRGVQSRHAPNLPPKATRTTNVRRVEVEVEVGHIYILQTAPARQSDRENPAAFLLAKGVDRADSGQSVNHDRGATVGAQRVLVKVC